MNQQAAPIAALRKRNFVSEHLSVDSWSAIAGYFHVLESRDLNSADELKHWLLDRSELESVIQEDLAWRYIRMSCDTTSKTYADAFNFFVSEIEPKIAPFTNQLNHKLLACPFISQLGDPRMEIMLRSLRKQVEIFREENIPLFAELQQKEQQYAAIAGAMTIHWDGNEITLQQASNFLKSPDRSIRESVYKLVSKRRLDDRAILDVLFDELIVLRDQIAKNASFSNYRDYMFAALGRFDYTPEDCFRFHAAIADEIVPLTARIHRQRQKALGVDTLKPWDLDADMAGMPALIPFSGSNDMMDKTVRCFSRIHPFLGSCIETLRSLEHIDLESRKGKAPGGFNYPLYETGVPFIFMNSTNSLRDLVTIVHEGGHAVHSILTRDLEYADFRSTPSEVAELASMSMELLTMEHWEYYFEDPSDLRRARFQHLEKLIESLPWIAAIDKFQHWVYTHPGHSHDERSAAWISVYREFSSDVIDWSQQEDAFACSWQKQLHLYQVPFYYIEYGMAQLGAIAIWRNYTREPEKTLDQYLDALKLGYTTTIGAIYQAAGIRFDFSAAYVRELSQFLESELNKLS